MMPTGHTYSHSPTRRRIPIAVVLLAAVALIAAACTDSGDAPQAGGTGEFSIGLRTDLSCDELVEAARNDVDRFVAQQQSFVGLDGSDEVFANEESVDDQAVRAAPQGEAAFNDAGAVAAAGGTPGQVVAGTNIQEAGVDEGDILKTDGNRIVALSGTTLRVVDLDGSPSVDGTLVLPSDVDGDVGEMFIRGDEVIVLIPSWGNRGVASPGTGPIPVEPELPIGGTTGAGDGRATGPEEDSTAAAATSVVPFEQGLRIVRVDISDTSSPEMTQERVVEGSLVSSRMVDGTVRVVLRSPMDFAPEMWSLEDSNDVSELFEQVGPDDILPAVSDDGEVSALGGCEDVAVLASDGDTGSDASRNPAASDFSDAPNTVTVLTIGDQLDDMAPVSVAGLADIVYASTDSLYVTSTGWSETGPSTFVHRFGTTGSEPATYTGSGIVPGAPLNQYSLSESGDQLRIVTTTEDPISFEEPFVDELPVDELAELEQRSIEPDEWTPATEGRLTVLEPAADGTLAEVGSIEDLGVGEEVQSVRFLGDMAYVVTFRRTDPLYAIDLSDPTDPRALGELKITGFSEYLHPIGDGYLLGIGREATEDGVDTGFKASVFDVSDPTNPTEVAKWVMADAWSEVGSDSHAFTWDPVAGHAIFPLEQYAPMTIAECPPDVDCEAAISTEQEIPASSAVVLSAAPDGLSEVARLTHRRGSGDEWLEGIRRSVVVDRDLWTMSHTGLGVTNADNPGPVEFIAF